jgi:hypothetical protein
VNIISECRAIVNLQLSIKAFKTLMIRFNQ